MRIGRDSWGTIKYGGTEREITKKNKGKDRLSDHFSRKVREDSGVIDIIKQK